MGIVHAKDDAKDDIITNDVELYLKTISKDEKLQLMKYIHNDMRTEAIRLACVLINRKRRGPKHSIFGVMDVPSVECNAYGIYMYELLRDTYMVHDSSNHKK